MYLSFFHELFADQSSKVVAKLVSEVTQLLHISDVLHEIYQGYQTSSNRALEEAYISLYQ
jgi:hypothetical protein